MLGCGNPRLVFDIMWFGHLTVALTLPVVCSHTAEKGGRKNDVGRVELHVEELFPFVS